MSASQPCSSCFRRVFFPLLAAGFALAARADVQTESPNEGYKFPDILEYRPQLKTDTYYGFNEFKRSPDDPPPALAKPPKKYATLTWSGYITEANTVDWIGSSRTEFSGAATYTGADYQNGLTWKSYLNASASDPGTGEFPYTVQGFEGGGCGELHGMVNVYKTGGGEPGLPGVDFVSPNPGSPPTSELERTFSGAMNWHWNDLEAPCNLMDFDATSDIYPVRGPVTETLSVEVTKPGTTTNSTDDMNSAPGWIIADGGDVIEATNAWRYGSGPDWEAGSQVPLRVLDDARGYQAHFKAPYPGAQVEVVLILLTKTKNEEFKKFAVRAMAKATKESDESIALTGEFHARAILDETFPPDTPEKDKFIDGVPIGKWEDARNPIDFDRVVRLNKVLYKPGCGCTSTCTKEHLDSIDWSQALGSLPDGNFAGTLGLHAEAFSSRVFMPAGLYLTEQSYLSPDFTKVRRADGSLRQIRTGSRLFDIVAPSEDASLPASSFEIRTYLQSAGTPSAGDPELWDVAGAPLERTRFSAPDSSGLRLRIERFLGGTQPFSTIEYGYDPGTLTWSLTQEGVRRTDRAAVVLSPTVEEVTTSVWDLATGSPVLVSKVKERIESLTADGITVPVVTERTVDPDGAALVSQFQYAINSVNGVQMVSSRDPAGVTVSYTHSNGTRIRLSTVTRPFGNAADHRTVTFSEDTRRGQFTTDGDIRTIRQGPLEYYEHEAIGRLVVDGVGYTTRHIRKSRRGPVDNALVVQDEYFRILSAGTFAGSTVYHRDAAGVLTLTAYALDPETLRRTETVKTGAPNSGQTDVVDGTRTVTVTNPDGELVSRAVFDIASGLLTEQQIVLDRDSHGRPIVISLLDGTVEERAYTPCCGLLESITRHGVATTYAYDALRRKIAETTAGITLRYKYDALDRVVETRRVGSDNSEIVVSAATYDVAGRLVAATDARGGTTTYAEVYDADGATIRTTTQPDLSTIVETTNPDGSLQSRAGTAVNPTYATYELGAVGDLNAPDAFGAVVTTTYRGSSPAATEWVRSYVDPLGRKVRIEYPDGARQDFAYNPGNQLIGETDPDGVTILYAYNARGELETRALDVNRNGTIDYDGADRITRTQREVVTAHGTTVNRVTESVWAAADANTPEVASVTETSADGLQSWHTSDGLTTQSATVYGAGGVRTQTATSPDGTTSTQVFASDRLQSTVVSQAVVGTLGTVNYEYDEHGRLKTATDARTGATRYTYFNDDSVHTVTTPDPDTTRTGDGYDPQVTTYAYDSMGRPETVTQPDGTTVHTTYWPTGAVKRTWGSRTYPAEYAYDDQGRVHTLTTWQDFAGNSGTAVTTWNYDPQRGWLAAKLDAAGKGASYRYTPAGRLNRLQRARDTLTAPLAYGYDPAGNLAGIIYPDATPGMTLTYDRLGRIATRADAAGTCAYAYHALTSLVTAETYTGGLLGGLAVNRSFDSFDRLESIAALSSQPSTLSSVAYAYDGASRLDVVTVGTNTAHYAYVPNSSLVQSVTFKQGEDTRLTATKVYDNLNRLTSISSQPSALSSPLSYAYEYNSANQRTRVTREDASRWNYGYDALGQVTSAAKTKADATPILGHAFGYTYDDIGNRKTDTRNALLATYTSTLLNTYSSRTTPGAIELLGTANPAASLTLNDAPLARQDSLFYNQVPVDNTGAAQYPALNVKGVNAAVTVEETRHAFIAQTPEAFTYDADGNLTDDARWHYTWNAENRLVEMQTATTAIAAGVPKKRLVFTYDALGRRVAKRVMGWDATANAWGVQASTLFLYDGWNLIAELNSLSTITLTRSYAWGLDLSGSLQGAGGVGGLLLSTFNSQPSTYASAYDGNGNVIGYVDMVTGTRAAAYEYNAFGETLIAEGQVSDQLPFRFSTKFSDGETGLLYYGLRYYNPGTGRWLSRDPIEEGDGPNMYAFIGNDGVDRFDLLGLACCRLTIIIELADPNSPTKLARKGLDGHTAIAIGNDFYDYGPQPREGGNLTGSKGGPWWSRGMSGRVTLDDVRKKVYPHLTNPTYEIQVDVCTDDCLKLREYWKKQMDERPRYYFYGTQCTSSVCRSLAEAKLLDGGTYSPDTFFYEVWKGLKNTCGPNAGSAAKITKVK